MGVLLDEKTSLNGGYAPGIDASARGQQGAMRDPSSFESSARYVKQRIIPVLVEAPPAMRYMDDYEKRVAVLKSLIEDRAISITGLNSTITWEFGETVEGNSGEMRETVTNATIERSVPAFSWPEIYGKQVNRFWEQLGKALLHDPDLGRAGIISTEAYQNDPNKLPLLESQVSFTVLFIEPNPSLDGVVNAWLCSNMMPKTGGENTGSRVMGEALESPQTDIEFTAITERGNSVRAMAQDYLDNLNKLGLNPDALPTFIEEISADVAAADNGFASLPDEVQE